MVKELESVVLNVDIKESGLKKGDIGTVVMLHKGGEGMEVEFVALDGETVAVVTLDSSQVRPIRHGEIAHARKKL